MSILRSTLILILISGFLCWAGTPAALAKGSDDNPAVVQIDPEGNDVDVNSLPAVKIDSDQNDVDATITNEVEIRNDTGAALAVDTGSANRIPYARKRIEIEGDAEFFKFFETPPGHYFVIEYVSVQHVCPSGCDAVFLSRLRTTTGGTPIEAYMTVHPGFTGNISDIKIFTISETVRLYVDPGNGVAYHAVVSPSDSVLDTYLTISGYLIPEDEFSLAP